MILPWVTKQIEESSVRCSVFVTSLALTSTFIFMLSMLDNSATLPAGLGISWHQRYPKASGVRRLIFMTMLLTFALKIKM